jgi:hypothetical protein
VPLWLFFPVYPGWEYVILTLLFYALFFTKHPTY